MTKSYRLNQEMGAKMFPVIITKGDGSKERKYITIGCNGKEYVTSNKEIQEAIESRPELKGRLKIVEIADKNLAKAAEKVSVARNEIEGTTPLLPEIKEFPEVTDIQGAIAILRGEPYKVSHLALKTPEQVEKKAEENLVYFPNLKFE